MMRYSICLNAGANGFNIQQMQMVNDEVSVKSVSTEDAMQIHPVLAQLLTAHEIESVIQALKALQTAIKNEGTGDPSNLFYHAQTNHHFKESELETLNGDVVKISLLRDLGLTSDEKEEYKSSVIRMNLPAMLDFVRNPPPKLAAKSSGCNIL